MLISEPTLNIEEMKYSIQNDHFDRIESELNRCKSTISEDQWNQWQKHLSNITETRQSKASLQAKELIIDQGHAEVLQTIKNTETKLNQDKTEFDRLTTIFDENAVVIDGTIVKKFSEDLYEIIVGRTHSILKTTKTSFSSEGRFQIIVLPAGTQEIELTSGFSENWNVYEEHDNTVWLRLKKSIPVLENELTSLRVSLDSQIAEKALIVSELTRIKNTIASYRDSLLVTLEGYKEQQLLNE